MKMLVKMTHTLLIHCHWKGVGHGWKLQLTWVDKNRNSFSLFPKFCGPMPTAPLQAMCNRGKPQDTQIPAVKDH